jgi:hypothetical protein
MFAVPVSWKGKHTMTTSKAEPVDQVESDLLSRLAKAKLDEQKDLTKTFAEAKREHDRLGKILDKLKPQIAAMGVGFEDQWVKVKSRNVLNVRDEELFAALKKEKMLDAACSQTPVADRVKALALLHPKIKAAREAAMQEQVLVTLKGEEASDE